MNVLKYIVALPALTLFPLTAIAQAPAAHLGGEISDITSIPAGLLIRFPGNAVPPACPNPGWMIVKSTSQVMISVILSHWMAGQRAATVYIDSPASGGYCEVVQYDPHS